MNVKNLRKSIEILKRSSDFLNMCYFQSYDGEHMENCVFSEKEAHECGTSACLAGWIALSPEWQKDGGRVAESGLPILGTLTAEEALAKWWGVEITLARDIIYPHPALFPSLRANCTWSGIQADEVIEVLEKVIDGRIDATTAENYDW